MIIKRLATHKVLIKYIGISLIATIINILTYIICINIFKDMYIFSNIISWLISILITFILNKKVVFLKKSENMRAVLKELILFYLTRVISLLLDTVILYICIEFFDMNEVIAKIISNASTAFSNYFINKNFIFK